MSASLVAVTLAFFAGQATPEAREPHPLAPSIPQLTKQEEAKIQAVINRFIRYDIGKLAKSEGAKALEDFHRLGPEAIFLLIDSFNEAANLEHSCPVVVIGKKIGTILSRSRDLELLTFAKETIGVGVTTKRHMGSVKDLQAGVLFRRGAVQRELVLAGNQGGAVSNKVPLAMSPNELAQAARRDKGPRLQGVLAEASKRPAPLALDIFALAASRPEKDVKDLARGMLVQNLAQLNDAELRKLCKHEKAEIRGAVAQVAGKRGWGGDLLDLLEDPTLTVQKAAHQALVQLNRGKDLGPTSWTSPGERLTAVAQWRAWWTERQKSNGKM